MATLFNRKTEESLILRVYHTFGRNAESNITVLQSPSVSRNHATIAWDGEGWKIKDISRNGTYINQQRISGGSYVALTPHCRIQFGNMPAETWEVVDLNPPVTGLVADDGSLLSLHDVYVLPVEQQQIVIYLDEEGRWLCETGGDTRVLHSGDRVGADGRYWFFVDGNPSAATAVISAQPPPNDIQFKFHASANEEHVSLTLIVGDQRLELGERTHHYLLLLLAKQRIADSQQQRPEAEQGWIKKEVLVRMMGMVEQHINIQIHRFRKQVATVLPQSATLHQVIERRPGELRFAYTDIEIDGGFAVSKRS